VQDFLGQCFIKDPLRRPNATKLMQHAWCAFVLCCLLLLSFFVEIVAFRIVFLSLSLSLLPLWLCRSVAPSSSVCPHFAQLFSEKRLTPLLLYSRIIACRKRKEPLYPQAPSSGGAASSPGGGPAAGSSGRASTAGQSQRNATAIGNNAGVATTASANPTAVVVQPDAVFFGSSLFLDVVRSAGMALTFVCALVPGER
jgi:hypothetical protein